MLRSNLRLVLAQSEQLRAEAVGLRIEFIETDLQVAMTFLSLARQDFQTGETEHGAKLLGHVERAREIIQQTLKKLPPDAMPPIRTKLTALHRMTDEIRKEACGA
jgi:hypothetical protein